MVTRQTLRRALLGRQVAVAYALLVALYLVRHVRFQPTQIPAYLLVVAYDVVELALPAIAPYHPIGFPLFLYLIMIRYMETTGKYLITGNNYQNSSLLMPFSFLKSSTMRLNLLVLTTLGYVSNI